MPFTNIIFFWTVFSILYRIRLFTFAGFAARDLGKALEAFQTQPNLHATWGVAQHCYSRIAEHIMPLLGIVAVVAGNAVLTSTPISSALARTLPFVPSKLVAYAVDLLFVIAGILLVRSPSKRMIRRVIRSHGALCPKCMYDLRSLMDEQRKVAICPECGLNFHGLSVPSVWVGMYYVPRFRPDDPNPTGRPWLDFLFRDKDDA